VNQRTCTFIQNIIVTVSKDVRLKLQTDQLTTIT